MSLVAAVAMVVGLSGISASPVLAADPTYSITIQSNTTDTKIEDGHTYEAYQLFTGTLTSQTTGSGATATTSYIITNVTLGSNLQLTALTEGGKTLAQDLKENATIGKYFNGSAKSEGSSETYATLTDTSTAAQIVDAISEAGITNDSTEARELAGVLSQHLTGTPLSTSTRDSDGHYVISGAAPGYYLLMDKSDSQTNGSASGQTTNTNSVYTGNLLQVLHGNITVNIKYSLPTVEKKVLTDSDGWADSAVKGSSDTITYKITGTLPQGFASYTTYTHYTFTDTLPAGVDVVKQTTSGNTNKPAVTVLLHDGASSDTSFYDENESLKSGYTDITQLFTVSDLADVTGGGHSFTISLGNNINLKEPQSITGTATQIKFSATSNIIVLYDATLNSSATTGANGNINKVNLEYSNNPNVNHSGDYGKTPDNPATVFSFTLRPVKYANNATSGNELEGAEFTLYGTTSSGSGQNITYAKDTTNVIGMGTSAQSTGYVLFHTITYDSNTQTYTQTTEPLRLKSGVYVLSETKTPSGYNTLDDIYLTIELSSTGNNLEATVSASASGTHTGGTDAGFSVIGFTNGVANSETPSVDSGVITANIINESGSLLPSTGGIGTTIFYVVGGLLIAGAAVLLIARRRRAQ